MALIGATCCMLLAFILPAYFHYRLHPKATNNERLLDLLLFVIGVAGFVLGTVDVIRRMMVSNSVKQSV